MTMTKPLHELSIAEAGRALRAGTVSSAALTQHALARIAALDPLLHSFVLVTKERALADAERADRELKSGIDKGPLHGVPYALKDIYNTAGIRTTCQSERQDERRRRSISVHCPRVGSPLATRLSQRRVASARNLACSISWSAGRW